MRNRTDSGLFEESSTRRISLPEECERLKPVLLEVLEDEVPEGMVGKDGWIAGTSAQWATVLDPTLNPYQVGRVLGRFMEHDQDVEVQCYHMVGTPPANRWAIRRVRRAT